MGKLTLDSCQTRHVVLRTVLHSDITCPVQGQGEYGPDVGVDFESMKPH